MGWWLGGRVGEGEVCGAGLQSQASAKPLPQSTDMGNEKGGGCYYIFFFLCFVTIPIQQWQTTKIWEGQTDRLTHRRTPTYAHIEHIFTHDQEQKKQPQKLSVALSHTDKLAHWHCMQIKEADWERRENRLATTIETAWGGGGCPEKHACYRWLLAHEYSQMSWLKGPMRLLGFLGFFFRKPGETHSGRAYCQTADHMSVVVLLVKLLLMKNCHVCWDIL